jgi:serine/threonine protein kinase
VIGETFDHFEVVQKVGAGGMGDVYRARDRRLNRDVAIKVLSRDAASDPERLTRFREEAKAISALNHPNVLTLHEIGQVKHGPYIVTELVKGRTVRDMLSEGPLSPAQALEIATQTALGLAAAHNANIIHRDVKPENLMVTPSGNVKILDFGLAKLSETPDGSGGGRKSPSLTLPGGVVGTPAYMSPEQLHGLRPDSRSDIYALGTVLYEMLTGTHPFRRSTVAATLRAILEETPPSLRSLGPGIPHQLPSIIERATAKDPDARFRSAEDLAHALRDAAKEWERPSGVDGPQQRGRSGILAHGRVWVLGTAATALVAFLMWDLFTSSSFRGPDNGPPRPERSARSNAVASIPIPKDKTGVAILPIHDKTGDEILADADIGRILSDAFVQILTDAPGLYVISPLRLDEIARSLGTTLREAATDIQIAREVGTYTDADAVLSGSLSRIGETYILSATLTELPSEVVLDTFQARSESPELLLTELTGHVSRGIRTRFCDETTADEQDHPIQQVATRSLDAYAHYVRGDDLVGEGRWSEAVRALTGAIEIDPEMALAWSSLSCAFSFAGDDERARAAHLKATELSGHLNERERRWIRLDGIWVKTGNGDLYLDALREYMRDYPDDRDSYFYAGLAEEYLRNDPRAAISWYEQAYGIYPVFYPVTKALVDCHLKVGEREAAIQALKRYLSHPFVRHHGKQQASRRLGELNGDA